MKERPILFKDTMVTAILEGRKTQTRRIIKKQASKDCGIYHRPDGLYTYTQCEGIAVGEPFKCFYGKPGDRLWVRETHYLYGKWVKNGLSKTGRQKWKFKALKKEAKHFDCLPDKIVTKKNKTGWFKRPSIFMPRWASRITLEITDIRVERVQEISEKDASNEGCNLEWYRDNAGGEEDLWPCPKCNGFQVHGALGENLGVTEVDCTDCDSAVKMFKHLWDSINDYKGFGWKSNPWVWKISFKKTTQQ